MTLRIVHENLADAASSLSANTTAGTLVASNMQNDYKTRPHRTTGTTAVYTLTWNAEQKIGAVILPATNLTATATIQVRLYSDTACTVLVADSTALTACPNWSPNVWGWVGAYNANAFALGGAAKTGVWFASRPATIKGCKVTLTDGANPAGYIDCSRLVVGDYFEPARNADLGCEFGPMDTSTSSRNQAGDLLPSRGVIFDSADLTINWLQEADRLALTNILRNVGARRNFFLSLFPSDTSPSAPERDHMIYGKRSNAGVTIPGYDAYSSRITIAGW